MSKGKKLLAAVAALALLIGGYFAVSYFLDRSAADGETQTEDNGSAVPVATFDADDVTGIKYVYGDETVELVKKDDKWQLSSDSAFPVNQTYPATMVTGTADLKAKRLIGETSDLFSKYGLSEPGEAYIFTLKDGRAVTVYIGDENAFSAAHYLNVSGTEKTYLVDSAYLDNFHYGLSDLAEIADMPAVASGDVTEIKVNTKNNAYELKNHPNGLETVYSDIYTWFTPDGAALDTANVSSFISTVTGFTSAGCGDYKATDEELEKYGFSDPTAVIEIAYTTTEDRETGSLDDEGNDITESVTENRSVKLTVGGYSTNGARYYARLGDSDVVYLVDYSYVESLDKADIAALRPKDVCMINMDTVDALDVTVDGKAHKLTVTRTKDDDGKETAAYQMDGKVITASDYNSFFSAIQGMQAETSTAETTDSAPYITVVYHRNTENFKTMTLKFIPFDSSFYLVDFNGERRLLANKLDVENVVTAFNAIKLQ